MDFGILTKWLIPALPALVNWIAAYTVEKAMQQKGFKPWQAGNAGRIAGILVFLLLAAFYHRAQFFNAGIFLQQQWPIGLAELLAATAGLAMLYAWQRQLLKSSIPKGMESYPNAGMKAPRLFVYAVVFIGYLFCYEVYFRGYFLMYALRGEPLFWVIGYNSLLYALVHMHKGRQQTLAAIPFGIVLCMVTLWTGHIWFAWLVHVMLALGIEMRLLSGNAITHHQKASV
jgi:membrane protease YdiL (CAAX protease family)